MYKYYTAVALSMRNFPERWVVEDYYATLTDGKGRDISKIWIASGPGFYRELVYDLDPGYMTLWFFSPWRLSIWRSLRPKIAEREHEKLLELTKEINEITERLNGTEISVD